METSPLFYRGMGKRDFAGPIDWLTASGMVYKVDRVETPLSPLSGYDDPDGFKIYLSDAGMLASLCGIRYNVWCSTFKIFIKEQS